MNLVKYSPFLVRSYVNKKYMTMKFVNMMTAIISIYDIKYPLSIQWSELKKIGAQIEFVKKGNRENIHLMLPLREVVDAITCTKLHKFVSEFINY